VPGLTFVLYGAIIVLIRRFQPGGILTLINRMWAKQNGKKPDVEAARGAAHLLEALEVHQSLW